MVRLLSVARVVGGSLSVLYIVCALLAVSTFAVPERVIAADASGSAVIAKANEPVKSDVDQSVVEDAADAIPDWVVLLNAVMVLAGIVAAATPTPKDNVVLGVLRKVIDIFALNVGGARNAAADKNKPRSS